MSTPNRTDRRSRERPTGGPRRDRSTGLRGDRPARPVRPPGAPRPRQASAPPPDPAVRRRRRRRVGLTTLVVVLLGGLIWGIVDGPLITARSVEVEGAGAVTVEEIEQAAAVEKGEPLVRMDTGAIEKRVETILQIASADVDRSLTGTVTITVVERAAVAVVPAPEGLHLIDASGTDFKTVPIVPPGLPELRVPTVAPDDPVTAAVLVVLAAIPEPLRPQLIAISADTPTDIRLVLADDREVRWGSADRSAAKGAILGPLLTQRGDVYDVSSPDLPTIS